MLYDLKIVYFYSMYSVDRYNFYIPSNSKKKNNSSRSVSIGVIDSKTIQIVSGGGLKYFFEPRAKTVEKLNRWGPYEGIYSINSDGLNERFDYSEKRVAGTFRIITLGDSYTFGHYVDTKNNWTEILEDKLNDSYCNKKIEVINLGVHSYDPTYEVERYRIRGIKYNPDLVIWFLTDPYRITELIYYLEEKNIYSSRSALSEEDPYRPWEIAQLEILKKYDKTTINKYQLNALRKINEYYFGRILFIVQKNGSLIKPFSYMYEFKNERPKTEVHEIISVVNNPILHFPTDFHPNIEGHKAIASDVFGYLIQNGVVPCSKIQ